MFMVLLAVVTAPKALVGPLLGIPLRSIVLPLVRFALLIKCTLFPGSSFELVEEFFSIA